MVGGGPDTALKTSWNSHTKPCGEVGTALCLTVGGDGPSVTRLLVQDHTARDYCDRAEIQPAHHWKNPCLFCLGAHCLWNAPEKDVQLLHQGLETDKNTLR